MLAITAVMVGLLSLTACCRKECEVKETPAQAPVTESTPAGGPKESALGFVRACQANDMVAARPFWDPTHHSEFESGFRSCSLALAGCAQTPMSQVLWDAGTYAGTGNVYIRFQSGCVNRQPGTSDSAKIWMVQIEGQWYVWEDYFASD